MKCPAGEYIDNHFFSPHGSLSLYYYIIRMTVVSFKLHFIFNQLLYQLIRVQCKVSIYYVIYNDYIKVISISLPQIFIVSRSNGNQELI